MRKRTILQIKGMYHESCAQIVEKALRDLGGVYSADVNFDEAKAFVDHDPSQVKLEDMDRAIAIVGYKVRYPYQTFYLPGTLKKTGGKRLLVVGAGVSSLLLGVFVSPVFIYLAMPAFCRLLMTSGHDHEE